MQEVIQTFDREIPKYQLDRPHLPSFGAALVDDVVAVVDTLRQAVRGQLDADVVLLVPVPDAAGRVAGAGPLTAALAGVARGFVQRAAAPGLPVHHHVGTDGVHHDPEHRAAVAAEVAVCGVPDGRLQVFQGFLDALSSALLVDFPHVLSREERGQEEEEKSCDHGDLL